MTDENSPEKFFEQASQLREDEVVIEFAVDRFQHFIGVKTLLFLALASKITEILNGNISCFGEFQSDKSDKSFNTFANAYCWESPSVSSDGSINPSCDIDPSTDEIFANPAAVINVFRWMPYYLLLKALLFAMPSAFWHYRIGGRLTGHLNFIKLLIEEAAECVKKLPSAIPNSKARNRETAAQLDGFQKIKGEKSVRTVKESVPEEKQKTIESQFRQDMTSCKSPPSIYSHSANADNEEFYADEAVIGGPGKGRLLDRHLFSMLCYENFSNFSHFLYFKSVCKATFFAHFPEDDGVFPLNQAIVKQWCHNDNFSGRFLVTRYYIKQAILILLSIVTLRINALIMNVLGSDIWLYDSFWCQVLNYDDRNVFCTLHRRTLMLTLLILDSCISVFCLTIGLWQVRYVSTNRQRQSSCFFENLDDRGSVAMLAALRKRQEDQQKQS